MELLQVVLVLLDEDVAVLSSHHHALPLLLAIEAVDRSDPRFRVLHVCLINNTDQVVVVQRHVVQNRRVPPD